MLLQDFSSHDREIIAEKFASFPSNIPFTINFHLKGRRQGEKWESIVMESLLSRGTRVARFCALSLSSKAQPYSDLDRSSRDRLITQCWIMPVNFISYRDLQNHVVKLQRGDLCGNCVSHTCMN